MLRVYVAPRGESSIQTIIQTELWVIHSSFMNAQLLLNRLRVYSTRDLLAHEISTRALYRYTNFRQIVSFASCVALAYRAKSRDE